MSKVRRAVRSVGSVAQSPKPNKENRLAVLRLEEPQYRREFRTSKDTDLRKLLPETVPYYYRTPLHSTGYKTWSRCKRAFLYECRLGLKKKGSYSPALLMGTQVHTYLEYRYKGEDHDRAAAEVQKAALKFVSTELEPLADVYGILPNGREIYKVAQEIDRDAVRALAIGKIFYEYHPIDPNMEVTDVEVPIVVSPKNRPRTTLKGTLDLVLSQRDKPRIWIMDHKTTSKDVFQTICAYKNDVQPHIYRLLAMAKYPDKSIVGCIFNVIQKCTIKYCPDSKDRLVVGYPDAIQKKLDSGLPLTAKQEDDKVKADKAIETDSKYASTFDKYIARVEAWYREKMEDYLETGIGSPPMAQVAVRFKGNSLPEETEASINEAASSCCGYMKFSTYPKCGNSYTCTNWIGMAPCPYLHLCDAEDHELPSVIENYYVQDHRDEEATHED